MTASSEHTISFIDTNVWLYAFNESQDKQKTLRAKALIRQTSPIALSTQVINEVSVNVLRKFHATEQEVRKLTRSFYRKYLVVEINRTILLYASVLRIAHHLSYWNSLIIGCVLAAGASTLYSEDMHDGLVVQNQLTIVNPFKQPTHP